MQAKFKIKCPACNFLLPFDVRDYDGQGVCRIKCLNCRSVIELPDFRVYEPGKESDAKSCG